jgi:hypothetical protein
MISSRQAESNNKVSLAASTRVYEYDDDDDDGGAHEQEKTLCSPVCAKDKEDGELEVSDEEDETKNIAREESEDTESEDDNCSRHRRYSSSPSQSPKKQRSPSHKTDRAASPEQEMFAPQKSVNTTQWGGKRGRSPSPTKVDGMEGEFDSKNGQIRHGRQITHSNAPNTKIRHNTASRRDYGIDQRERDTVQQLGISRYTVEGFRDLAPSHIGGQILNKVYELRGNEKICFRCGDIGHLGDHCATWKTQSCPEEMNQGECALEKSCPFAHRSERMRTSFGVICSRVRFTHSHASDSTIAFVLGCKSRRHHISRCPYSICVLCTGNHASSVCTLQTNRDQPSIRTGMHKGGKGSQYGGRGYRGRGRRGGHNGRSRGYGKGGRTNSHQQPHQYTRHANGYQGGYKNNSSNADAQLSSKNYSAPFNAGGDDQSPKYKPRSTSKHYRSDSPTYTPESRSYSTLEHPEKREETNATLSAERTVEDARPWKKLPHATPSAKTTEWEPMSSHKSEQKIMANAEI